MIDTHRPRQRCRFTTTLQQCGILAGVVALGLITTAITAERTFVTMRSDNDAELRILMERLKGKLVDNAALVRSLSFNPYLQEFIADPTPERQARVHLLLDRYQQAFGLSTCYLMDRRGTVVATSNRNGRTSFLGKNYSFRPYFTEAIGGRPHDYFALGVTSGRRGYYSSHPVSGQGQDPVGVIVFKRGLEGLDRLIGEATPTLVTNPQGLVFLANRPELRFRTLWPLTSETRRRLLASRQFGKGPFWALFQDSTPHEEIALFEGSRVLIGRQRLNQAGWQLVRLQPLEGLGSIWLTGTIITGAAALALFLALHGANKRRELRLSQQQTQRRSSLLERAIQQASDGICMTDMQGRILFANHSWLEMHDIPTDHEIKGQPDRLFFNQDQFQQEHIPYIETLRHEGRCRQEVGHQKVSGTPFTAWTSSVVLTDDHGRETCLLHVCRDISEEVANRQVLERAIRQAHEANRTKDDFLRNMSHELRTPMNGIIGVTDLLTEGDLDEDQQRMIDLVSNSADKLLELIQQVMDFTELGDRGIRLEEHPVRIKEELRLRIDRAEKEAKRKGLTLRTTLSPGVPEEVMGDGERIKQLLDHLLDNAVKFTAQGVIEVVLEVQALTLERVTLEIAVRDTGIGIEPEHQERIFQAFTQADESLTRDYGGSGLGLALARRLTQAMDGDITVESEPGRGSTFRATLTLDVARKRAGVATT